MHILAITPGQGFDPAVWGTVLHSGVDAFMVREPALEARDLLAAARWCRQEAPDVALWMRGRLDVALAAGTGLHAPERHPEVPGDLLPISRPLHTALQFADRCHAQQLLIAPVFDTPGKGPGWGLPALHAFLDALEGPAPRLLALGGVDGRNASSLRHPRLAGVALIRALWDLADPHRVVDDLRAAWA